MWLAQHEELVTLAQYATTIGKLDCQSAKTAHAIESFIFKGVISNSICTLTPKYKKN